MIYESRLELCRLLYADFDVSVRHIVAQPCLLISRVKGAAHQHIPDYLLITKTGPLVVDVKARSMSRQAEAERDRRARVITADGELQASEKLAQAAEVMAENPAALQLRLLETVVEVAAEKNFTLVFPFPVELLRFLERATSGASDHRETPTLDPPQIPDDAQSSTRNAHRGSPYRSTESICCSAGRLLLKLHPGMRYCIPVRVRAGGSAGIDWSYRHQAVERHPHAFAVDLEV